MPKDVEIWNPDLPEGPGNKRPGGKAGELTLAQQWGQQHQEQRRGYYGQKGGRKPVEIDWLVFAELCQLFCTKEEIAGFFKCSVDTIERACKKEFGDKYTFKVVWNELSAGGKISLRRAQRALALKGNALMLIWLGKQVLGQRDTPQPAQADDDDDQKPGQAEVYGTTFVGQPGEEFTLVNAPPDAVRPSNANDPAATGPAA